MPRKKVVIQNEVIHNADGSESLNPTPMFDRSTPKPLSMQERVRRAIRQELSMKAADEGHETFEESQDFDVDDGFEVEDPTTPYEMQDMVPEYLDDEFEELSPETEPSGPERAPAEPDPAKTSGEVTVKAPGQPAVDTETS